MAAVALFQRVMKRRFVRFGVPFLLFIVGGSFGLKEFTSIRYTFRESKKITNQEAQKLGIKMKMGEQAPSVEKIYEEIEKSDLDSWENIRGPRPWEDSRTVQDMQREKTQL